jgi:hypothetical protein
MQGNTSRNKALVLGLSSLLLAGAALIGSRAHAEGSRSERETCSNGTLRGRYAFNVDGTILAGPNRLLLRGVAMTDFDGQGNLTQVDFTTINGVPTAADWRPAEGSYRLNPDCTGTMEIVQSDGSAPLHLWMVVGDKGRTIHNVVVGNPTGATGIKVD